ncbi:MAG: alanine racemase [Deltaproteobacteria bacterium]|uniref:Alanine racemase n=1 Tax=Candidatus Zymogenus saltonus TaxID=2844893 RepID=A0A9D8PRS8_9DELT|nr:alanine racemase [Candidatus Zymogenus saltonus]
MFNETVIRDTRAVVDLDRIRESVSGIRKLVGDGVEIMAVVKADGYGHGAVRVAKKALRSGAESLAVAYPEEGAELRDNGITAPVLVLGLTSPKIKGAMEKVVGCGLTQTVADTELPRALNAATPEGKRVPVHIKVDTGMGRIGIGIEDVIEYILFLKGLKKIEIEGIYTHFPSSDEADKGFTKRQIEAFLRLLKELKGMGIDIPKAHMANSGGILAHPKSHLTSVRAGIMLYGLYPSGEVERSIPLTPAMSFITRVRYLKKVPKGTTISYGRSFVTERETAVATLPVGYADGYLRILSNRRHVLVGGKQAPIIGRVCMDMTMVDVTDISGVEVGDEVVLFGRQGESEIHIDQMAEWLNTINYEVTCIVGKRVPRVYINE